MPIDPARVQAVLFDVDGTLRDTDDEVVTKVVGLLRPVVGSARAARLGRAIVMGVEGPTQLVLGLADRLSLDGPLNRLIDYASPRGATHLVPGAGEAVAALAGRLPMGIVSAGPARAVDRFLDEHGLRGAMGVVVTGQTYARTKPHPMPVIEAARALGVAPDAALMVGDTTVDIKAGQRAGAQTLGVLTGFGRRQDLAHVHADDIVASLAVLPVVLEGALG